MATKMIKEGKETYTSKGAMMKHEKKEPMKKEKAEEKMAKGGMSKGKAGIAIMIGIGKPKKMATGGMPMVEKDGQKVPAFAADGKGKMAKGGMAKKKY